MKISTEQLSQHLARDIKPLYTVYGNEPLLALEAGDRIRATLRGHGYGEREVLTVEAGFDWNRLAMAGNSQSLFSSRKLLEVRVPSGKPGNEGAAALQAYCGSLPADTVTLVCLPEVDWRTLKAGWFEALERMGVAVEAKAVPRKALPQWLAGRLKAQNQDADAETLEFIANRVEGNLLAAFQEVQKLALLFPAGRISFEQARDAVLDVTRYDVFNLGEVMVEGDPVGLSRMLDGLKGEGTAPPLVLWALCEEIRAVGKLVTAAASGRPISMALRDARVFAPARQALLQKHLPRFTLAQVTAALRHAATIDRMVKGLARGDVWDELLQLGLRFARGAAARPATSGRTRTAAGATAGHLSLF